MYRYQRKGGAKSIKGHKGGGEISREFAPGRTNSPGNSSQGGQIIIIII